MWESPVYKFKTKIGREKKEILLDVTGSAPNFSEPGKQLEGTFGVLLQGLDPKRTKILDFGGAKLRNTLYLLKKGYTVYACEFEDLFKRSKQANNYRELAKKFPNFKRLVFPNDFIGFDEKFDVVLLINVLNIMPVPIERLCVLALCREKMKEGGRLLWYTQHGAYSTEDAVTTLYDGLVTGKGRKYHMFYRDFQRKEIHDMLKSTGFSFNKTFTFPMSGSNQSYVFNADGDILVDETLRLTELLKKKVKSKFKTVERKVRWSDKKLSKAVVYKAEVPTQTTKVEEINILKTYLNELGSTKPGKKDAAKYHDLIFNILKSALDYNLKDPVKEDTSLPPHRVDITFKNLREEGFFKELDQGYHITCPNIFIECKNYSGNLDAPAFAQIQSRMNKVRGRFGIIVCRKITNKQSIKSKQINLIKDEKYVIVLDDKDIKKIVKWKLAGDTKKIDTHFEEKFKKLI